MSKRFNRKIATCYEEVKEYILLNGSNEQRDIVMPCLDYLHAEVLRLKKKVDKMEIMEDSE
jgi:hypothetical protein